MKLSLAELKVDSYAMQVSETELTAVKGGSSWPCVAYAVGAALVTAAATITTTTIVAANDHKECSTKITTKITTKIDSTATGVITTVTNEHICGE